VDHISATALCMTATPTIYNHKNTTNLAKGKQKQMLYFLYNPKQASRSVYIQCHS